MITIRIVLSAVLLGVVGKSFSQTARTWNGVVNSDWFNPVNWTPSGVPAAQNTINFSSGTITLTALVNGTLSLGANFQGGTITNLTTGATLSGNYQVSGTLTLGSGASGKPWSQCIVSQPSRRFMPAGHCHVLGNAFDPVGK